MQAPPPFPFWPLSSSRPKRILAAAFESRELQSLGAFKEALAARGQDYETIRTNDPASLLLDLSTASEAGLLRKVAHDWGVVFSLWKASDAYMESTGERRRELRQLLKHLFFWADHRPGRFAWPARLVALQKLFHREAEIATAQQRAQRAEALALRLATALEKITRVMRTYLAVVKVSLRPQVQALVRECEAVLEQAKYLERNPRWSRRAWAKRNRDEADACKADSVSVKLASTMEKALVYLKDAVRLFRPVDAFGARHAIRAGEAALQEVLPEPVRVSFYARVGIRLFDAGLYVGRLLVGFWLIPLVLAMDSHARRRPAAVAS